MAKRKGSPTSRESASSSRRESEGMDEREAWEVESIQWLEKLPPEVWEKILDNLEENDLFPLALSCRYFRQKQKELVARTRQSGPGSGKPRRALKTTFHSRPEKAFGQPVSADYLRFCSKEEGRGVVGHRKASFIQVLTAFHSHLPLLQELLNASPVPRAIPEIARAAGKSSSS